MNCYESDAEFRSRMDRTQSAVDAAKRAFHLRGEAERQRRLAVVKVKAYRDKNGNWRNDRDDES